MRKHVALAATALLLLAGACTSGEDSTDEDRAGGGEAAPLTGPAPGVTDDTIKVGVSYIDFTELREVIDIDQGDFEAAYTALFDDINAGGGIHGRTIEPVFAPVSPIDPASTEEACVRLTEDEDVFLAMGFFRDDSPTCFLETHETAMIGGSIRWDLLESASAPWFSAEQGEDFQADAIARLAEEGLLGENVGVFAITTEADLLDEVAVPALEEAGIEPVDTAILDAPVDDVAAQNAAVAVIAERFRSSGVDQVLVVGTGGITWANGVESTDYRPQLILTDKGPMESFVQDAAGRDLSMLEGALGVSTNVPPADGWAEPSMQECLAVQEAAGYVTPDPASMPEEDRGQEAAAFISCTNVALFRAIAEAAGPDLNYGTWRNAGENLGEITIPGAPEPYTYGPPPSNDGDAVVYTYEWDGDTDTFVMRDEA